MINIVNVTNPIWSAPPCRVSVASPPPRSPHPSCPLLSLSPCPIPPVTRSFKSNGQRLLFSIILSATQRYPEACTPLEGDHVPATSERIERFRRMLRLRTVSYSEHTYERENLQALHTLLREGTQEQGLMWAGLGTII